METIFSVTETVNTPFPGYIAIDHDADKGEIQVTVKHKGSHATIVSVVIDENSSIDMAKAIMSAIGKLTVTERKAVKTR
jgi:hypothetical protein